MLKAVWVVLIQMPLGPNISCFSNKDLADYFASCVKEAAPKNNVPDCSVAIFKRRLEYPSMTTVKQDGEEKLVLI